MTDMSDNKWQSGNVSAFESLYRQHRRLVFKSAYLMTGSREDAEDILQEVFMSAWKSRHTFNPNKGKITTWLYRITVNKCLERGRKRRLHPVPLADFDHPDAQQHDALLVTRQEYDELIDAMNSLDAKHRSVLVLRYFNGLSYKEIAQAVGIPLGTVKSRVNNGLKQLRNQFDVQHGRTPGQAG
jgi:RNA polymerase sigma-70 factor, ECF subfamily